jgi:hypothetical protein
MGSSGESMQLVMNTAEKRRVLLLAVLLVVYFERVQIADFMRGFFDGYSGVTSER